MCFQCLSDALNHDDDNIIDTAVVAPNGDAVSNGVSALHLNAGDEDEADDALNGGGGGDSSGVLSSSLEAEQRLLREMGWSEEETIPITEEEIREIQELQSRINQVCPVAPCAHPVV